MDYEKLWDDMNLEDIFGAPVHSVDSTPGSPWSTSVRSPGAESSVSVSSMRSEGAPTVNRVSAPGRSEITVSVYEEGLRRIGYGNVAGPSTKDHVVAVAEQIRKKQDLIRSFECGKLPELLEEIGIPGIQCVCRDCARKGKVMLEDELKDASSAVREGGLSDIARSKKRAPIDPDLAALQKLRLIDKLMGVSFKACLGIHRVLQDLNVSQFRVHKVREPHARRSTDLFGNGGFKPYPTPVLDAGRSVAATEGIRRRSVAQPSLQSETSVQRSRRKEVSVVRVPHNGGLLSKVTQGRTPTTTSPKVVERGPGRPPKLRDNRRQQLPTSTLLPAGAENSCPEVLDVDVVLREDHDGTVALPRDLEELFDDCLDSIKCNSSALASNCMRNAPSRKRLKPGMEGSGPVRKADIPSKIS